VIEFAFCSLPPFDWPYFHERLSTMPDLSDELRKEGGDALAFLERELGRDFFETCGKNHPVEHKIMMAGGIGQLKEFIRWVQVLKTLKTTDSNYAYLLKKLHLANDAYVEGIPFIEISGRHLAKGFGVYFPREKQGQKNPDLELTFLGTGEKVFVEVTRISEGRDQKMKSVLYHRLLDICFWHGNFIHHAGKLYEMMPEEEWPELIERVKQMKEAAFEKQELVAYQDQYLAIAFAHPDRLAELNKWCGELNLRRGFDGFNVEYNYTSRMIRNGRIDKEAKQIPDGKPGMIYCPVHPLYPLTMDVQETVTAFAADLARYDKIFALVFYGEVMPALEEAFIDENENYINSVSNNEAFVSRYTLMVKNPSFNLPLSEAAGKALVRAAI